MVINFNMYMVFSTRNQTANGHGVTLAIRTERIERVTVGLHMGKQLDFENHVLYREL